MPKYECKICNYNTERFYDLSRHKESKRHKNKEQLAPQVSQGYHSSITEVSQNLKCKFCHKTFSAKCNLYRHMKYYCKKQKISEDFESIKEKNIELELQNKKLINTIENQSEIAKTNSGVVKKSINVLNYALSNFNEAPAVGLLEDDKFDQMARYLTHDIKGKRKTNKSVEEIIIFHHKQDTLIKILGDLIIYEYKKENPEEQSIWSSDISRLTFIVRDIIGKTKNSKWITDKRGLHIIQTVIIPMTNIIKDRLVSYINKSGKIVNKSTNKFSEDKIKDILDKMHEANLIIFTIKLGKVNNEILKYIAPYFNLSIDK